MWVDEKSFRIIGLAGAPGFKLIQQSLRQLQPTWLIRGNWFLAGLWPGAVF